MDTQTALYWGSGFGLLSLWYIALKLGEACSLLRQINDELIDARMERNPRPDRYYGP